MAFAQLLVGSKPSMQHSDSAGLASSLMELLQPAQPLASAVSNMGCSIAQLATAVLGCRRVCQTLLAAGWYADASQQMQQAVRVLYPALLRLQLTQVDVWGDDHLHGACSSLAGPAMQQLVVLAVQVADNLCNASSTADTPKELASFAVLNLVWSNLTRALAQGEECQQLLLLLDPEDLANSMSCALRHLVGTCMQLENKYDANRLRVAKFWLQGVLKTGCASASTAVSLCWNNLQSAALSLYTSLQRQCGLVGRWHSSDMHGWMVFRGLSANGATSCPACPLPICPAVR